ncbi:MAG TPA: PhzF family isomerase [Flavobacterium sp.]|jgi:PhzF family phenazine biosynthesis protein
MSKKYIVYQINSFTERKFSGNPAGVVLDATGLSDTEMLLIAREINCSETAFIFPLDNNTDCKVEIRFFTPTVEVPICGHATIAAHYVRALNYSEQFECLNYSQKTKVGILPIQVIKSENKIFVKMTQGKINFEPISENNQQKIMEALGINANDLLDKYPIEIASTGHSKVMIGIKSNGKLNTLKPDLNSLVNISNKVGCNGYFVFCVSNKDNEFSTNGRMFAPAIGINEDPVTGNANGPLGAYLVKNKLVNSINNEFKFVANQGEAINRFGSMNVEVLIENNYPIEVNIQGTAVEIFKTEIEI